MIFSSSGVELVDRGFTPDILKRGLRADLIQQMGIWGMESIGLPVAAPPGYRSALWFGTIPNRAGEIAVVRALTSKEVLDRDTEWFSGYAHPDPARIETPDGPTIGDYTDCTAGHATLTPTAALVRAWLLLDGPGNVPEHLHPLAA